eukprot:maker-scaffold212_size255419-snap-gene-1.30 protein:Tk00547 transcript:maker-scaffold212_size255419-snap-gene-1.30-mRNA-1 annotation:"dna-directed rna polymerase ii subunit grinl1a isoform x2"
MVIAQSNPISLALDSLARKSGAKDPRAIKKVPGELVPMGRLNHEAKKFRDEILHKSVPELKNLLERQEKILQNSKLIQKLPDKGNKLKERVTLIQALLEAKTKEVDETADLFKTLTIGGKSITVDEMEWKYGGGLGRYLDKPKQSEATVEDLDGSRDPVLKVLAEGEAPAVKETDCELDFEMEKHALTLSFKADHMTAKTRFLPFRSLHSDKVDDSEIKLQKRSTARLKPEDLMPMQDGSGNKTKMVPLEESIRMQLVQAGQLRDIHVKQAMDRLAKFNEAAPSGAPVQPTLDFPGQMDYRSTRIEEEDDEEEDPENQSEAEIEDDEAPEPKGVSFNYSVYEKDS